MVVSSVLQLYGNEGIRKEVPDVLIEVGKEYVGTHSDDVVVERVKLHNTKIVVRAVRFVHIEGIDAVLAAVPQMVVKRSSHNIAIMGAVIREHQKFHINGIPGL